MDLFSMPLVLSVLCFECVPDRLPGPSDTFLIRVGVHSQRDRRITMAQPFTDGNNVRAVGDTDTCRRMPELVRVKILYTVFLPELLKIPRGTLRVHWLRYSILCKTPF